eukprot:m.122795 g.122795  ORF g.122795 m.122795 type:complete len:181 (+) comp9397_c0_seq3:677-1219(+)
MLDEQFKAYLDAKQSQEKQYSQWEHIHFLLGTVALIASIANIIVIMLRTSARKRREQNIINGASEEANNLMSKLLASMSSAIKRPSLNSTMESDLSTCATNLNSIYNAILNNSNFGSGENPTILEDTPKARVVEEDRLVVMLRQLEREQTYIQHMHSLVTYTTIGVSSLLLTLSFFIPTS